ncbi:MAG: anti-sigma F factor [Syntrophaceticus schinkii]|jgi:stage II sporulation protein AB (anti-sigma F factor)|nr:anti-sigma F factor [Syntrophaceticus schinkii]MDD4260992.1 anti-sigma F factor [Syntrophaceticus schinkii]MDD4674319.1 anti-sigma F factor [Syntrophaceticus schinkii]
MKMRNRMKLELLSLPGNVRLARVAVAAFASEVDYNVSDLEEIKVAVSEAVSNAITHGYQNEPNGLITLTATLFDNSLEIVIEDEGKGIEDIEEALQSTSSDPERMGLGFVFMRSFMDEVDVASEAGQGTRVILRKNLPGEIHAET